VEIEVDELVT